MYSHRHKAHTLYFRFHRESGGQDRYPETFLKYDTVLSGQTGKNDVPGQINLQLPYGQPDNQQPLTALQ